MQSGFSLVMIVQVNLPPALSERYAAEQMPYEQIIT
jgi:hypothetical protein